MFRRQFLQFVSLSLVPQIGWTQEKFWEKPRTIRLIRQGTDEKLNVTYWANGKLLLKEYSKICWLMRDTRENKHVQMDPLLIDTLWGIQEFLRQNGIDKPLTVTSGYRTFATNRKLQEAGVPAATQSMHLYGRAVDFKVVGHPLEDITKLLKHWKVGGVGTYVRGTHGGWIHVDTGRVRTWKG